MTISADALGHELVAAQRDVTPRETLAYAAGLGWSTPTYLDDASDAGIVAPPPYCVSLEWPVVSAPESRTSLEATETELRRGVHASQDTLFHRPLRPDGVYRTTGRFVEMRQVRAGTLVRSKLETHRGDGELVATSWTSSIYRQVALEGNGGVLETIEPLPRRTSELVHSQQIAIAPELPHVYTECARIWNPIHTERAVALAAGLPDIILHGTATWALAAQTLIDGVAAGDPTRLARFAGRFTAMVLPGTSIEVRWSDPIRVADGDLTHYQVLTSDGKIAIDDGAALTR